jgi:membrane-associated protein
VAAPTARAKQPAQRLLRQLAVLVVVLVISASLWQTPAVAATAARQSQSWLQGLVSFVLHLDVHLGEIIATHGRATYAILFAIVFCETGLVLTPFLPGDSLLFACGTFAAKGTLNLGALLAVFITSAILGDAVNYAAGNYFGAKALKTKLLKREYIAKTEQFYQKYGGKAVVLSRFVPIIRTFAPFVAGVGSMQYSQFAMYNVAGALIWSVLFTGAGYLFGGLAFVQHNFTLVVLAIVAVSVVPVVFEVLQARKEGNEQDSGNPTVWDNAGSAA